MGLLTKSPEGFRKAPYCLLFWTVTKININWKRQRLVKVNISAERLRRTASSIQQIEIIGRKKCNKSIFKVVNSYIISQLLSQTPSQCVIVQKSIVMPLHSPVNLLYL